MVSQIQFRLEALRKLYGSREETGLLQVLRVYSWPLLYASIFTGLFILGWGLLGSIPYWVQGEGLLVSGGSTVHSAVATEDGLIVVNFKAQPGDLVEKDQVIAEVNKPDLQSQVNSLENQLDKLKSVYDLTKEESDKALKVEKEKLDDQNGRLKVDKEREETFQGLAKDFLKDRRDLAKKKLIARSSLMDIEKVYLDSLRQSNSLYNQMSNNEMTYNTAENTWSERLRNLEIQKINLEHEFRFNNKRLQDLRFIKSPIQGRLLAFHKNNGDGMQRGEAIASITQGEANLEAIAYLPVQDAKRIQVNQEALISPSVYKKEEYGGIEGTVLEVGAYPVTPQEIKAHFQNDAVVKSFSEKGPYLKVRLKLKPCKDTKSGYLWSSSQGPDHELSAGTWSQAQILVEERRPLSLLLPALKSLLGVS